MTWRSAPRRAASMILPVLFLYATSVCVTGVSAQANQSVTGAQPDTLRLSLSGAAALAAQRNPAVVASRARTSQSEARVLQARSALLPHVSAYAADGVHSMNTATFGIEFPTVPGQPPLFDPNGTIIGGIRIVDFRARVQQSLFDYASMERTRGARAAVDASEATTSAIAAEAASGAAAAYVQTLRALARVNARQADIRLAEELVQIAQNQLTAGVGVALDVTRARTRLAGLQAQLIADNNAVSHARLALTDALGVADDQPIALTDSLGAGSARTLADNAIVASAIAHRRDLQAYDQQIRAAEISARAISAERYPTFGVAGDEGFIGKAYDHLLNTYSLNAQISVPVFSGYAMRAREQEQNAVVTELQARREQLRRQIEREVRDALLDERSTQEQVVAARANVSLAEQQVAQARERFTAGVAGNADLVEASLILSAARTSYIDALAAVALADVSLTRAQGLAGTEGLGSGGGQ